MRPVHIRNVGLPRTEPLDGWWKKTYGAVGVQDVQATVESFVDIQLIRAYCNSHAFAVKPSIGLLRQWFGCFEALVCDQEYQSSSCQDERHEIFLHQVVLSALLATSLERERMRVLPPDYSYPYDLHRSVPRQRRAHALNDVVSIAYEHRSLEPDVVDDINTHDPLRSWLAVHAAPNNPPERTR